MSGTNTANEVDTFHGWVWNQENNPGQNPVLGGPARFMVRAANRRFSIDAGALFSLVGTDFSVGVGFVNQFDVADNQVIFSLLSGGGVPGFNIEQEGPNLHLEIGDGFGAFNDHTIVPSVSSGFPWVLAFSFDFTTKECRVSFNESGTLHPIQVFSGTDAPLNTAMKLWGGGWSGGDFANGSLAAPTIWLRKLPDAELELYTGPGTTPRLHP